MTADTPIYLGSITKTYTAATVLKLVEGGRLTLDDTVDRFIPSFPNGSDVTVRHLLSHTSGIKDFYLYLYFRPDRDEMIRLVTKRWSEAELLELAGRFGRDFDPGTDWSYSNANYYLLGVIIERVCGLPLTSAYRHHILEPLGLRRTWLAEHEKPATEVSAPTGYLGPLPFWKHSEMFGELGPTTVLDRTSVEWAAGGMMATAEDAARFLRDLLDNRLLSPESLSTMSKFRPTPPLGLADPNTAPSSTTDGYGFGLIRMESAGTTLIGHGGILAGHEAGLWHIPEHDVTFAIYFNRGFVQHRAVLDEMIPVIAQVAKVVTKNPKER